MQGAQLYQGKKTSVAVLEVLPTVVNNNQREAFALLPGGVGLAKIPDYTVWDLSLEWALYRQRVQLLAGIQNLFDRDYFSRVRSDGIEPMPGRSFYAGLRLRW